MAIINKKLVHFRTKAKFEERLAANDILDTSIVFIKDEKLIWTHGEYYAQSVNIDGKVDKVDNSLSAVGGYVTVNSSLIAPVQSFDDITKTGTYIINEEGVVNWPPEIVYHWGVLDVRELGYKDTSDGMRLQVYYSDNAYQGETMMRTKAGSGWRPWQPITSRYIEEKLNNMHFSLSFNGFELPNTATSDEIKLKVFGNRYNEFVELVSSGARYNTRFGTQATIDGIRTLYLVDVRKIGENVYDLSLVEDTEASGIITTDFKFIRITDNSGVLSLQNFSQKIVIDNLATKEDLNNIVIEPEVYTINYLFKDDVFAKTITESNYQELFDAITAKKVLLVNISNIYCTVTDSHAASDEINVGIYLEGNYTRFAIRKSDLSVTLTETDFLEDGPVDEKTYGRSNGAWKEISTSGGSEWMPGYVKKGVVTIDAKGREYLLSKIEIHTTFGGFWGTADKVSCVLISDPFEAITIKIPGYTLYGDSVSIMVHGAEVARIDGDTVVEHMIPPMMNLNPFTLGLYIITNN